MIPYIERSPTREEVEAHAKAHPVECLPWQSAGLWMEWPNHPRTNYQPGFVVLGIDGDGTLFSRSDDGINDVDATHTWMGEGDVYGSVFMNWRFRPCVADGTPVAMGAPLTSTTEEANEAIRGVVDDPQCWRSDDG